MGGDASEFHYDVFIAHAAADLPKAEMFRQRLEDLGCRVVLDAEFLTSGDAWDDELLAAQQASRVTVVLLSPGVEPGRTEIAFYLKEEIALAITLARDRRGHRVVPIELEPVELAPYGLNRLHRWQAYDDAGLQSAAAELVASLREPDPERVAVVVGAVPVEGEWFTGRDDLLGELERTEGTSLLTQALSGMGGVGKSTLAAAYAHSMEHVFDVIWWVRAETGDTLEADLAELAERLGLRGDDRTARARAAIGALERSRRPWLVVFDNAIGRDLIEPWLPRRGPGQVIITSRDRNLRQIGRVLRVEVFDDATSEAFLRKRVGDGNPTAATDGTVSEIVTLLQGLPLALEQAAAWVARNPSRTWAAYRSLFERADRDPFPGVTRPAGYDATATTTWQVSIQAATEEAALAPRLLGALSFLAPDAIPLDLFTSPDAAADPYLDAEPFEVADALDILHAYSLIDLDEDTIGVHRVVQHATRPLADPDALPFAARRLGAGTPADVAHPDAWARCRALLPHVRAVADRYEPATPDLVAVVTYCVDRMANYLHYSGSVLDAIPLRERVLTDAVEVLGDRHPDTLSARNNLALSYWSAGRTADAIALGERVLADAVELLGDRHPDTLTARANLALSYWSAGRTNDAIALQERVLADRAEVFGDRHPETFTARGNLAVSYRSAGRTNDAIALQEQVLTDAVELLGDRHPDTLTARAQLAASYWSAGRTTDAIALQERVLADRVDVLGDRHPETLTASADLALSYRSAGRTTDAIALQERVLADRVDVLGDRNPGTLSVRAQLAASYWSAGRTTEAVTLLSKTIEAARSVDVDPQLLDAWTRELGQWTSESP